MSSRDSSNSENQKSIQELFHRHIPHHLPSHTHATVEQNQNLMNQIFIDTFSKPAPVTTSIPDQHVLIQYIHYSIQNDLKNKY
jgi:hypothetical protein